MSQAITIVEIAKESGVSIATVSRVLNGSPRVAPETRRRVEETIEKYGYSPNALARSLVSNQSMTIGVIVPDISNPYFAAMFSEIERAAHAANYSLFLCNTMFTATANASGAPQMEVEYFQMMLDKKVDGVLVIGGQIDLEQVSETYIAQLKRMAEAVPVAVIGRPLEGLDCIFIQKENDSGVATAINYLAALGHKRIAFVGGEPGVVITESRLAAYRATLAALGLPCEEGLVSLSDYYAKDGYAATHALLQAGEEFTAVLAMNDNVALGAVRALADKGLQVPGDVALISCDQFFNAEYNTPRLTSIDQHNELFGRLVIQSLLCAIKGIREPVVLSFTPELIVRESSGAAIA